MMGHAKRATDDLGNALGGPDGAGRPERFGATRQQADKLAPLRLAQALRPTRWPAMAQRLRAIRSGAFAPLADGAFAHRQRRGDLVLGPTALLQVTGAQSPPFAPIGGFVLLRHAAEDTKSTNFTSLSSRQ
jgi:hypothetical protein